MSKIKEWSFVNYRNATFIILLLLVLGITFGVVHIVGLFDESSMYTSLIYGKEE